MDFWLTSGSTRLLFPLPPEQVTIETGARILQVEALELGEVAWPRGEKVRRVSWEGILPGAARRNLPGIKQWREPREILAQLSQWRVKGEKVRLLVTETTINLDVYVAEVQQTWGGGHGDARYEIVLVEARDLTVATAGGGGSRVSLASARAKRPAPPPPTTYMVRSGDSLWSIAQRMLGSGSRWRELYELNRSTIGKDPNLIRPGQVLRLPAR